MVIQDCKKDLPYILHPISVQYTIQTFKFVNHLLILCQSVKEALKLEINDQINANKDFTTNIYNTGL